MGAAMAAVTKHLGRCLPVRNPLWSIHRVLYDWPTAEEAGIVLTGRLAPPAPGILLRRITAFCHLLTCPLIAVWWLGRSRGQAWPLRVCALLSTWAAHHHQCPCVDKCVLGVARRGCLGRI